MCIVCAVMGNHGADYKSTAICASFFSMRVISPIMFFLESCATKSGKMVTAIVAVLFLALFIIAQAGIGYHLNMNNK